MDYRLDSGVTDMDQSVTFTDLRSATPIMSYTYGSNTADGVTVPTLTSETNYPDGSSGVTTNYSYTFYTGTNTVQQMTTTYPAIPTGQNGSGATTSTVQVNDAMGHVAWTKDARGYITRKVWDVKTGQVLQQIDDVDTAVTSDEPSGWTTPTGGGLPLVTDNTYDDFGRMTESLRPAVNVITDAVANTAADVRPATWMTYVDGNTQDESDEHVKEEPRRQPPRPHSARPKDGTAVEGHHPQRDDHQASQEGRNRAIASPLISVIASRSFQAIGIVVVDV